MPETYTERAAKDIMRRTPNLLRWYDRAHAVRTHEHCHLGPEHIEGVVAAALEAAYQDGLRDGALAQRRTALEGMISMAEGIEASMRSRVLEVRRERDELLNAPRKETFPK